MIIDYKKLLLTQIEKYIEYIELNPEDWTIPYRKPISPDKKREYDRALKDTDKTITLNPGDASAYYNRGPSSIKERISTPR